MSTRFMSLVQQKKLQWSQEREEMTKLYGLWLPVNQISSDLNHKTLKENSQSQVQKNKSPEIFEVNCPHSEKCLPPIQKISCNGANNCDVNKNTESSGYASETDWNENLDDEKKRLWKSQSNLNSDACSVTSKGSYGDDAPGRLKWGDRGVGVGHLWEPTNDFDARLPEIDNRPGTPHWLQKTLMNNSRTHLRGYSIPVEPNVVREREEKRQKALELQEAIRQQLLERDKKRKEERELQIEEERKLEQRIKEQQEMEDSRMEAEIKKRKEREEKEKKKCKAMQEALAAAERKAKEVKMKIRNRSRSSPRPKTPISAREPKPKFFCDQNNGNQACNESKNTNTNNLIKMVSSCDAHTSLTIQNYFDDFKSRIPLVMCQWTQTNNYSTDIPRKLRKNYKTNNNDRPKWGMNRSTIKYMKQSEKDPFYKHKLKHKSLYSRSSDHVTSASGCSVESTDEYNKSPSSVTQEKYFSRSMPDINRNRQNMKTRFQLSPPIDKLNFDNISCDSDENQELDNYGKMSSNRKIDSSRNLEESQTHLSSLLNKRLKMEEHCQENELKRKSLDLELN